MAKLGSQVAAGGPMPLIVNVDRLKASLSSECVKAPSGMSREEKLQFLLNPKRKAA